MKSWIRDLSWELDVDDLRGDSQVFTFTATVKREQKGSDPHPFYSVDSLTVSDEGGRDGRVGIRKINPHWRSEAEFSAIEMAIKLWESSVV